MYRTGLKNAPWAFQLAHVVKPDAPPALRTIGFKRVTDGVLATAPAASFSQTLAVAARGVGKRTELAGRDSFFV